MENFSIDKLISKAYDRVAFFNTPGGRIGEWIRNLSPVEREILKNLTSKDTEHRLPTYHGMKPLFSNWYKYDNT